MSELSVIVPYCQEWPTVAFTIRALAEEMKKEIDFEIIAIGNFAEKDLAKQGIMKPDRGHAQIPAMEKYLPWLKSFDYTEKLSHWNAKNYGISKASSDIFLFCDAHCIPGDGSIRKAFGCYRDRWKNLNGTLHLPLTYHIIEEKKLIYKLVYNKDVGELHYSFTGYHDDINLYEVPCMSTCGMFMHRTIYDRLGGWPTNLGIYGGGENFINFTMAVLGMSKWIMPGAPLYHHGDKRGYSYNYDDYSKNRAIASYLFGGKEWLDLFIDNRKGDRSVLRDIRNRVLFENKEQRSMIRENTAIQIDDWASAWKRCLT